MSAILKLQKLSEAPVVMSKANQNFKCCQMMNIESLVKQLDPNYKFPDIFKILKAKDKIRQIPKGGYSELSERKKELYDEEVRIQQRNYRETWLQIVKQSSTFPSTEFINFELAK